MTSGPSDVVVIGAGLAGVAAASVLGRRGLRVVLVDPREVYPSCFKAEKIEPDQADLFRKLGLFEALLPLVSRIREVSEARGSRVLRSTPIEQYGIFYQDMVNGLRRSLPGNVDFRLARVASIAAGRELSRVSLVGGDELASRLVVLATGTGGNLHERLGLRVRMVRQDHSFACGFTIEPLEAPSFSFDSLSYFPDGVACRIDYLTLFPIHGLTRANLFSYRDARDAWVKRFAKDPHGVLSAELPGLSRLIGGFRVRGKVEMSPIDLYQLEAPARPGLVAIGDAFQSVCPATGTGLTKVLTDVDVLCSDCVPAWMSTPEMGEQKIQAFYDDARKVASDTRSILGAAYRRRVSTDPSLRWRIHRERVYADLLVRGIADTSRRGVATVVAAITGRPRR